MNDDMQASIRVLIMTLLGMPSGSVRPANQSQPTEGDSYAIMSAPTMIPVGWAGDDVDAYQTGMASFTIDFIGTDAGYLAGALKKVMQSYYASDVLQGMSLGFMDCTQSRNLSIIELERTQRYQVTMTLSYSFKYDLPAGVMGGIGNFEKVNITLIAEQ